MYDGPNTFVKLAWYALGTHRVLSPCQLFIPAGENLWLVGLILMLSWGKSKKTKQENWSFDSDSGRLIGLNLANICAFHLANHIEHYLQSSGNTWKSLCSAHWKLFAIVSNDWRRLGNPFAMFFLTISADDWTGWTNKHLLLAHLSLDWDVRFAAATFDTVSAKTLKLPVSKDALGGGDGGLV